MAPTSAHSGQEPGRAFIPPEDRPSPQITLDTPLSELRVRDLQTILGGTAIPKSPLDPVPPPKRQLFPEGPVHKAILDKVPDKFLIEYYDPRVWGVDPSPYLAIEQVIAEVTQLGRQVSELAGQIGELRSR
jgi:hypothetical protein